MKDCIVKYILKVSTAYLFLLVGTAENLTAQSVKYLSFDDPTESAYRNAFKLKIDTARVILENSTNHSAKNYILNITEVIELLVTEDESTYEQYSTNYDQRLDQIDKLSDDDPRKLFYKAEIQLQWSLVHLKFGEEISAAWNLRQAFRYTSNNLAEYPAFVPSKKTMGLLHVILGSVPDKYHWFLALLGMEGDVRLGLSELHEVANKSTLLADEALATIAVIESYLLQRTDKGSEILDSLLARQPDNLLLRYLFISALIKNHRGARALNLFENLNPDKNYLPLPFLDYLAGELYLQKGFYKKALIHYLSFLEFHPGQNYVKDAYYKIFLLYWLQGKEEEAGKYRKLAMVNGVNRVEADKHAQRQLKTEVYPVPQIMKIRLLTDGGYYKEADSLIRKTESEGPSFAMKDEVEFIYRKARHCHLTGKGHQAIELYQQTIERSSGQAWYWGANSALQLGYLYRDSDPVLAEKYFKMAISMPKNEYKDSINNKARSALKLIR